MPTNVPTVEEFEQLSARLTALGALVGAQQEQLDRALARIAALEPVKVAPALVGSSSGRIPWADVVAQVGHDLAIRRSYQPEGTFTAGLTFDRSAAGIDVGRRASLWSFKGDTGDGFTDWPKIAAGAYDDRFTGLLASVPTDHDLTVACHHERDGGHGSSGDGNPADAVAVDRRLYPLVQAANKGRRVPIRYAVILMGYTVTDRLPDQWFDPACCDVLGFDVYSPSGSPFAGKAQPLLDYAAKVGKPALVAETGTPASPGRAQWITDAISFARAHRLVAWCYWNGGSSTLVTEAEFKALGT